MLLAARRRGLHAVAADLRNSGDTAGPRGEVVGYGSFLFT
jgi:AmmeMemoRadiSam system protein B